VALTASSTASPFTRSLPVNVVTRLDKVDAGRRAAAYFQHWADLADEDASLKSADNSDELEELLDLLVPELTLH
jgi:hypothetical protein